MGFTSLLSSSSSTESLLSLEGQGKEGFVAYCRDYKECRKLSNIFFYQQILYKNIAEHTWLTSSRSIAHQSSLAFSRTRLNVASWTTVTSGRNRRYPIISFDHRRCSPTVTCWLLNVGYLFTRRRTRAVLCKTWLGGRGSSSTVWELESYSPHFLYRRVSVFHCRCFRHFLTIRFKKDKDATDYFRGIIKKGEKSPRVLELTETIIRINPAHYSAWYFRSHCQTIWCITHFCHSFQAISLWNAPWTLCWSHCWTETHGRTGCQIPQKLPSLASPSAPGNVDKDAKSGIGLYSKRIGSRWEKLSYLELSAVALGLFW